MNNSLAIQTGDEVTFHWGKRKASFFSPPDGKGFLWPGAGIRIKDSLYLFLHRMKHTKGGGAFGFVMTGTLLARIADPDLPPDRWTFEYHPLPWFRGAKGGNLFFGAGALVLDGTLYVYGADEDWSRGFGGRALIVARVPADRVQDFARWRFRTREGWAAQPETPERLC